MDLCGAFPFSGERGGRCFFSKALGVLGGIGVFMEQDVWLAFLGFDLPNADFLGFGLEKSTENLVDDKREIDGI